MRIHSFAKKFDWPLLALTMLLTGMGLMTLFGIGQYARDFFWKQLIFLGLGVGVIFLVSRIDYRIFRNYSGVVLAVYGFTVVLLLAVLQFSSVRAVKSWITIHTFQFEPSELAKIAAIIILAKYFSQRHVEINDIKHIIVSAIYIGIPAGLVLIQPDLGSASVFFAIWIAMLLAVNVPLKHFIAIAILVVIITSIGWVVFLEGYQKARITSFLDPFDDPRGAGYSMIQSKIAIGAGGWFGAGLGNGTQATKGFLPEAQTDFIFSAFVEQFGFFGAVLFMIVFSALVLRIIGICRRADNNFAKLFGIGFIALITSHTLISIGINIGLLPVTGIPLSFLSSGGSHLMVLMTGIGIIESIKVHGIYA